MQRSLSNDDIHRMLRGRTNILAYRDLADVDRLEDVLVNDSCVLLYETSDNVGHWCCVFIRRPTTVDKRGRIKKLQPELHWFDSYGMMPDSELRYIDGHYRKKSDQKQTHLTRLILDWIRRNKGDFRYSQYRLQKLAPGVNTCGRFVVLRLTLKDLSEDEFARVVPDSNTAVQMTGSLW